MQELTKAPTDYSHLAGEGADNSDVILRERGPKLMGSADHPTHQFRLRHSEPSRNALQARMIALVDVETPAWPEVRQANHRTIGAV